MPQESISFDNLLRLDDLWVFGYGSLIWNPGFEYVEDFTGYIEDFSRKFWQGNVTHRGRPGKPGRVVTLTENKGARVWGKAFHVVGADNVAHCLDHLGARECEMGGYEIRMIDFKPCKSNFIVYHKNRSNNPVRLQDISETRTIKTLTFIALSNNNLYLGPASSKEMADCLLKSEGPSGRNLDYMLGILEFLKFSVPYQEMLQFEQEILDIERNIWIQLQQEGFGTVADCHGFYLKSPCKVPDCDCIFYPVKSEKLIQTSSNSFEFAITSYHSPTPLLETIRLIEILRNEINNNHISESTINISSTFTHHLFTNSEDDSDSGLSSMNSSFESLYSDHVSEFYDVDDESDDSFS